MGAEGDEGAEENEGDDGLQFSHLLMVRAEGANPSEFSNVVANKSWEGDGRDLGRP